MCEITGMCSSEPGSKTYYVPLDHAQHPSNSPIRVYDLSNLLLRTHTSICAQGEEVEAAKTDAAADHLAT